MKYTQPSGQILLFAPSYSGKTYLTQKFTQMGLLAFDLEKLGTYVGWCNDSDGTFVKEAPVAKSDEWLATHHFLMNKNLVRRFLSDQKDCIVFAHAWNILECLDIFDYSIFMYLSEQALEERMKVTRNDHTIPSEAQLLFMKKGHKDRYLDAKSLNIPIIDASKTPEEIYFQIIELQAKNPKDKYDRNTD